MEVLQDEPEFKGIYWQMRVQEWLRDYDIFSPVVVGTDETQPISSKPHVELRAARDIKSGEPILAEQRISNVTTSISEPLKEDEEFTKARDLELSYCTGCASLIAIPWKLALKTQKEQILPPYVVSTCAQPCRQLRLDLNIGMCATNIEQELCNENLDDSSSKMMTERKTQCLRDLIFLRHVAMAMTRDKSPLDFKQLVFATCGPHTRDASEITELDRWSYTSHVVRPLAYLDKHLASTNTDQFANLDKFDGWIIHALLSKISRGMRVLKGPQYAQVYHKDTKPKISFGPNHPCWKDLTTKLPGNKDDDSLVWIAGINPLLNMIRIADPAKGESANVAVLQEDALFVFAAETGDGSLAVRAGEPLLRTEDERENRKLLGRNGRVYTGEQLGRGFLDVTDDEDEDDEEEEGAHSGDTSEFLRESSEEEVEGGGEGEGGVVLPAEDPRAGDWFSSWSWRNGRLSMG